MDPLFYPPGSSRITTVDGGTDMPQSNDYRSLAEAYTAAWCSQDPDRVASFYAKNGSLTINNGEPAAGREAIAESARGFMTAFPDMKVIFDGLEPEGDRVNYHWTLEGTNTGPGGTGRFVRISGYESWIIGEDGLIADSRGHFEEEDYNRQLGGQG